MREVLLVIAIAVGGLWLGSYLPPLPTATERHTCKITQVSYYEGDRFSTYAKCFKSGRSVGLPSPLAPGTKIECTFSWDYIPIFGHKLWLPNDEPPSKDCRLPS